MNNYEAINEIKRLINNDIVSFPFETVKALEYAIEALKTHIPKEPRIYEDGVLICPVCKSVLDDGYRCRMCGQLIDYEEYLKGETE